MKFQEETFLPMLFGGDINTYSVARAFYEQYGIRSHVFGKFPSGPSYGSRITVYHADRGIDTDEVFLSTLRSFAGEHRDKKILAIGCGDSYVALISKYRNQLPENVIAPYIDYSLMHRLQQKELFYELCEKHGIDYPKTFIFRKGMSYDVDLPFSYPVILKPSNSVMYWEYPFAGQDKVFKLKTREEVASVLRRIYEAGYSDSVILQDTIPGNDEYMRVLTAYSGRDQKVKMMCLGHVLLEEHTPHGLGNHAVIVTEPQEELLQKVRALLEDLGYVGFSNFDIKYDTRDGKYKFFEINTRQGRSNYYVTGSGFNVAKYFVEDFVYHRDLPFVCAREPHLWMVVPRRVAFTYVKQPENRAAMRRLIREGKWVNPVFLKGDCKLNRFLRMVKQHFSHYKKYRTYYR